MSAPFSNPLSIPILGFCAYSGTGKTTLLKKLIPELNNRGFQLAVIKHAHHNFDIDIPGKDSYEMRKAGARQVLIASHIRWALITEDEHNSAPNLTNLLQQIEQDNVDIVLIEGFKALDLPKIELHRSAHGKKFIYTDDKNIQAIACCDDTQLPTEVLRLDINNPTQIADFVIEYLQNWKNESSTTSLLSQFAECNNKNINETLCKHPDLNQLLSYITPINESKSLTINKLNNNVLAQDIVFTKDAAQKDEVILTKHHRLQTSEQKMLSFLGIHQVTVFKQPKIALFSISDASCHSNEPIKIDRTYNFSHFMIQAIADKLNCEVINLGTIQNSASALSKALSQTRAHVIINLTSIEISAPIFNELEHINFCSINASSCETLAFGKMDDRLFFSLSGTPDAIMNSLMQLIQPGLRKLSGETNWTPNIIPAVTDCEIYSPIGHTEFILGYYHLASDGKLHVTRVNTQNLAILDSIIEGNCFILIKAQEHKLNINDTIYIQMLTDFI